MHSFFVFLTVSPAELQGQTLLIPKRCINVLIDKVWDLCHPPRWVRLGDFILEGLHFKTFFAVIFGTCDPWPTGNKRLRSSTEWPEGGDRARIDVNLRSTHERYERKKELEFQAQRNVFITYCAANH